MRGSGSSFPREGGPHLLDLDLAKQLFLLHTVDFEVALILSLSLGLQQFADGRHLATEGTRLSLRVGAHELFGLSEVLTTSLVAVPDFRLFAEALALALVLFGHVTALALGV